MTRWLAGSVLVLVLLYEIAWFVIATGDPWFGWDARIFYLSGELFRQGDNPYIEEYANLNPPISVYVFSLLSRLGPAEVHWLIIVSSVVVYVGSFSSIKRHWDLLTVLWLATLAGFWHTLVLGNIYIFFAGAATVALYRGAASGVVAAIKINFLVWPVLLAIGDHRRVALAALGTGGVLWLIPLIGSGPEIYRQYFQIISMQETTDWWGNSSLGGMLVRYGLHIPQAIVTGLIIGPLVVLVWRTKPDAFTIGSMALVAAPLAAPIAWSGYTLFIVPVLLSRPWAWPERIAAGLLALPLPIAVQIADQGIFGTPYTWAMLIVLFRVTSDKRSS